MRLTRVFPPDDGSVDLDEPSSRDRMLEWYRADPEWLRLNLVVSANGAAAGSDGTSETLTSRTDRRILGVIRELSDVVLVGAASVRAEGYQVPKRAQLAIVTMSGDLSGHRLQEDERDRVTVICAAESAQQVVESLPGVRILIADSEDGSIPPQHIVRALRDAGYRSIVCEGGPTLATSLLEAGLVDEVCLTTSPVLRDASVAALTPGGAWELPIELRQLLVDDDSFVFARWATGASRAIS